MNFALNGVAFVCHSTGAHALLLVCICVCVFVRERMSVFDAAMLAEVNVRARRRVPVFWRVRVCVCEVCILFCAHIHAVLLQRRANCLRQF